MRQRGWAGWGWAASGVAVLAVFALVGVVTGALAPAPSGPALSSFATTPSGVAAWAELLTRDGHPVRALRTPLATASLPLGATLVVLGGSPLSVGDRRSVDWFVNHGGRLIAGGTAAAGVRAGGSGPIVVLPDVRFLQNRSLAAGGNALRSLQLAGPAGRPVIFDEYVHGYGETSGLAALPGRWWLALIGLGLAAAAWALSRAIRVGGPDPEAPPAASPRSAYVEALAGALAQIHDPDQLAELASSAATREHALERTL